MQPNFSALITIQAMIVTESQIPNCGLKGYCWGFNTSIEEEESDIYKEELLEFT